MARPVHDGGVLRGVVLALIPTMLTASCVIPPSLSVDTADAGANAAPAITSVRADNVELPEYQRVIFERGLGSLNLSVHDTDLDDKLFCKVFIDYSPDDPTPPRANNETAGSTVVRTCTLPLAGLCQSADIGVERLMSVVVFDRQVIEGEAPLYQAMIAGGLKASRTLFVTCVEASQ